MEIYQSYFPFCLGKVELKNEQLQTQRMHLIHFDSTDSCCRRPQNPASLFVDVCCSLSKRKPRDEVAGQSTDPGIPGIQESQSSHLHRVHQQRPQGLRNLRQRRHLQIPHGSVVGVAPVALDPPRRGTAAEESRQHGGGAYSAGVPGW